MWAQLDDLRGNVTRHEPAQIVTGVKPRRFRPWWLAAVAAVVLLPVIGYALGGAGGSRSRGSGGSLMESAYPAALPAATAAAGYNMTSGAANAPAALPAGIAVSGAAAPAQRQAAGSAATADSTGFANTSAPATNPQTGGESKIIRTGTISLTVKDVSGTMNAVWNTATDLGGFVVSSSTQGAGDDARGEITLRVPAERYNAALERLRGYGKVLNEKSTAQDVSEEYVDLQARRRNLELTVAQLQTLLGQAKTVDETLKVQTQLNGVQGDLERVRGRINFYDNRAAFSTITATLGTPVVTKPSTGPSFADGIAAAWQRSLTGLQGFIELVVSGWWLILLAIAAVVGGRRYSRRRPAPAPAAVVAPPAPPATPTASPAN